MKNSKIVMRMLKAVTLLMYLVLLVTFGNQQVFAQQKIYWTAGGNGPVGQIQSANINGTGVQTLIANTNILGSTRPAGIALDVSGGKLYWADFFSGIYSANLDGTGPGPVWLGANLFALQGIDVDPINGKLYWGPTHWGFSADMAAIRRSNLDGTGMQLLLQNTVCWFPGLLAVDATGGKMYWGSISCPGLFWSNLDGSGSQLIGNLPVRDIDVDSAAGKIYFTAAPPFGGGGGSVNVANLNGTGAQQLIGNLNFPYGIAVDPGGGKIYWSDIYDGKIRRADVTGLNQVDLITGIVSPGGIALTLSITLPLDIKPGSCPNPLNTNTQGKGRIPMAILGTDTFDVNDIDPTSISIAGAVFPLPVPVIEDVGTPFDGEECDCHELEADGFDDLVLHFSRRDIIIALGLGALARDTVVPITVEGELLDGTPFEATDCIRIIARED